MANYATLKAAIIAAITENGNNEITGNLLQQQLLAMVNSLGVGYQYAGIATPATNPGTPDQNVFYLASTAGTYANFGGLVLADGEIAILKYNGVWSKDSTGAALLEKVNQLGQKLFAFNLVPESDLTLLGGAYMDDYKDIKSTTYASVYYYPVESGKRYKVSSDVAWGTTFVSVGFSVNIPEIGGAKFDQILIEADAAATTPIDFIAPSNGYILLMYHITYSATDKSFVYEGEEISIPELNDKVNDLEEDTSSMQDDIEELQGKFIGKPVAESDLTLLGGSYMNDSKAIVETQYAKIYYYPVVSGKKYMVASDVAWGTTFVSVGFSTNVPTIGGSFDQILIEADTAVTTPINFVAPSNGYVLLLYHVTHAATDKSFILIADEVSLQEMQSDINECKQGINECKQDIVDINSAVYPLKDKVVAVLGDSIMQFMGGGVPTNTITLKNYDDPTDPAVYQTTDATVIGGIIYLTSSLSGGQVAENSVRLDIVNSAQSDIDSRGWNFIKDKLDAADIINCGQGGGRFGEMGIVTAYPSVTLDNPFTADKLQGLPNQVRMLKRLVDSGQKETPNVIIIWMGVNGTTNYTTDTLNEAMAISWDTLSDDALGYSYRTKFFGAIRYSIESLYRAFPDALIMFFSPVMTNRGNLQIDNDNPAYRGFDNLKQVSQDIRSIAERYSCMFFDALTQIGVANFAHHADTLLPSGNQIATGTSLGNLIPRYIPADDGIHPNAAGKIVWGNYLCKMLTSFYFDKAE